MSGKITTIAKSQEETFKIAEKILSNISKQSLVPNKAFVVGLSGDLGAGKTTFVQAVAKKLGIKNKVNSPTFLIIKKYSIKNNKYKFLFHLDAYRLKNEHELIVLGWEEIIKNKENLVFIEWPENVSKIIPPHTAYIHISHREEKERQFETGLL